MAAYSSNLNHYWSGLAALQMCAIAKSLADEETWEDAFDDENEAKDKKEELLRAFEQLKDPVELAVKAAQKRLPVGTNDRIWADIANADRLFITNAKEARVLRAYKDAVPPTELRFVSAVKAQLELWARLGIRTTLVEDIIKELGSPSGDPPRAVVILAGHSIDEPGRGQIRFPGTAVPDVTERLRDKLAKLNKSAGGIRVLSSAAPGTDIICHELCRELGIKSIICLPTRVDSYSTNTFKGDHLDDWRGRFLALIDADVERLQLSDTPGLPKWLQGTGTNEWERGNNWVLQLALSVGTPVSLIAVWDGKDIGDARGGTAHMVQIARAAGTVVVDVIRLKDGAIMAAAS